MVHFIEVVVKVIIGAGIGSSVEFSKNNVEHICQKHDSSLNYKIELSNTYILLDKVQENQLKSFICYQINSFLLTFVLRQGLNDHTIIRILAEEYFNVQFTKKRQDCKYSKTECCAAIIDKDEGQKEVSSIVKQSAPLNCRCHLQKLHNQSHRIRMQLPRDQTFIKMVFSSQERQFVFVKQLSLSVTTEQQMLELTTVVNYLPLSNLKNKLERLIVQKKITLYQLNDQVADHLRKQQHSRQIENQKILHQRAQAEAELFFKTILRVIIFFFTEVSLLFILLIVCSHYYTLGSSLENISSEQVQYVKQSMKGAFIDGLISATLLLIFVYKIVFWIRNLP